MNTGYFWASLSVAMLLISCIPCLNIFLYGPVLAGIFICFFTIMRGERVDFGMMFKGFDNFVPPMVVGIIAMIPEILGQGIRVGVQFSGQILQNMGQQSGDKSTSAIGTGIILAAAGIGILVLVITFIVKVLLFCAIPLIAEHNLGAVDAMKLSAKAGWANVGGIIVLLILEGLMVMAGVLALCIGVIFVIPIIYAANAIAYRQIFPGAKQNFQSTPPLPNIYGGSYGTGQ